MSKVNEEMKKAVIKTILETSTLKNKPNFIDNFFIKSLCIILRGSKNI